MVFRFIAPLTAAAMAAATALHGEPIHLAARKGDVAAIDQLLAQGVQPDQPSTKNTSLPGVSALYVAAQFGKMDAVRALVAAGADPAFRPTSREAYGTPMHMAARRGSTEIIEFFLTLGVDPNIYDPWLGTPLHQARINGHSELEMVLIANGAQTEWKATSISHLLTDADVENGRVIVKGCAGVCHSIEPGADTSLWDIVGTAVANRQGYEYSTALRELGGEWSYDALNSFLAAPARFLPGTGMYYSVPDSQDRADVIAYLRTLSETPRPFPE